MPNPPVPYNLKPGDTKLPEGHDATLDPPVPPTDSEKRSVPPTDWPAVDTSKGSATPPEPIPAAPPTLPDQRVLPPFQWPESNPEPMLPRPVLLAIPEPDIDPDLALWRTIEVSIAPFTGPPTEGQWPAGWLIVDNTATLYVCTVGGEPGTWEQVGSGGGSGPFVPIANPAGATNQTETPDEISGTGSATWVQFPAEQSAIAFGIEGNAFPSFILDSAGALWIGDGSAKPSSVGGTISSFTDANRGGGVVLDIGSANSTFGAILGANALTLMGNSQPGPDLGAQLGDIAIGRAIGSDASNGTFVIWQCSTPGVQGSAVWQPFLCASTNDPITAGVTPTNAGIPWFNATDGSMWMSTGTGAGDWEQIWPLLHHASSVTSVGGTGSTQTLITTPSLGTGVWKIDATLQFSSTTLGHNASLELANGTATATYAGGTSSICSVPGSAEPVTCAITVLATVTAAGTVLIQTVANAAGTIDICGYTAMKIA